MSSAKKNKTKNEIKGVLFDWDGTLLDSFQADSSAYLAMFQEMGVTWGIDELAAHYSPNWYDVYRAAGLSEHRWGAADTAWRKHYSGFRPKLIPGARKVLTALGRQYKLGLVTSGDRDRVVRQLREFRLTRSFKARVCSGDTEQKKPHPAPLNFALRCIGLKPTQCVYVGDSPEDIQMAKSAHVRAVGVIGPFPTEQRLRAAKPDVLLNSITGLPAALEQLAW